MTETPERIWAIGEKPCPEWEGWWHISPAATDGMTEYIRADLVRPMTVAEAATHWAITSPSGVHIGLWSSYETAKRVFDNEVNGSKLWPLRALSQGGE